MQPVPGGDEDEYDVFISFVTDPDYLVAKKIRDFLGSFDSRVNRSGFSIPKIRVFVDSENLLARRQNVSVTEELGEAIQSSLRRSRYLLVLCSRATPNSNWVGQELDWYCEASGVDGVLLGVTEDIDPVRNAEAVFPRAALDRSLHRRLWYDLRGARAKHPTAPNVRPLEDVLTQLAANITGKAVAEVTSAWYREQRRLARNRTIFVSLTACAVLAAVIGGYQAYIASNEARHSAAERFTQSGVRYQSEGDLISARSAFRESLKYIDTPIGRAHLADVVNLSLQPQAILDLASTNSRERAGLTTLAFVDTNSVVVGDKKGNLSLVKLGDATRIWSRQFSVGITALTASSGSATLIIGLEDGRVLRIDPKSGTTVSEKKFATSVLGLRLDDVGKNLAIGLGDDAGIIVLDPDAKELLRLGTHAGSVQGVAFNKKGDTIYWGGSSSYIWACPVNSSPCQRVTSVDQYVYSIDVSDDARYSAAAVGDRVVLFDHALQKANTIAELSGAHAYSVAFDPSNRYLAVAGSDGFVRVYDVQAGNLLLHTKAHKDEVYFVAFSPRGDRLVSVGLDGNLVAWSVERDSVAMRPHNFRPSPQMLASPQRNQIVDMRIINNQVALVATWDQQVRQYDLATMAVSTKKLGDQELRRGLAQSFARFRKKRTVNQFSEVETWKVGLGSAGAAIEKLQADNAVSAISEDGRFLALANQNGATHVFDSVDGTTRSVVGGSPAPTAAIFLDGQVPSIAIGYKDGMVRVFDGVTLKERFSQSAHRGSVELMLSSDACKCIYSLGRDGWLRALSMFDGHEMYALEARAQDVMAITADGKVLAIGGLTGSIELIDALLGRFMANLSGHRGGVGAVDFDLLGDRLYSGGFDEVLRRWNVSLIKKVTFSPVNDVLAETALPSPNVIRVGELSDSSSKR